MSLPAAQRRALNRIEKTLANDDFGLGPRFAIFTSMVAHEAMPVTERVTSRSWRLRLRRVWSAVVAVAGLAVVIGALIFSRPLPGRRARAWLPATRRHVGSAGKPDYRGVLAGRGGTDIDVKDLVVAEHRRVRIRPATMIGKRPRDVEQAAGEQQHPGRGAGVDPHPRQRKAARTAEPGEHRARCKLRQARPHQADGRRGKRQRPHHDQAGQPETGRGGEKENGSCRAGDKEEDHRLVQALQSPPPGGSPGAAVIQRARPEQGTEACRIDSGARDLRGSVRAGQQQRAARQ